MQVLAMQSFPAGQDRAVTHTDRYLHKQCSIAVIAGNWTLLDITTITLLHTIRHYLTLSYTTRQHNYTTSKHHSYTILQDITTIKLIDTIRH